MDSVSQLALGAAVGVAVMGRRTSLLQSAGWGTVLGTLPDLDVFIDHGDPLLNMVLHRAESHALFWLTLVAAGRGGGGSRQARAGARWGGGVLGPRGGGLNQPQ
ncbi:MAG: metal-dependent hydrolase, partial [Curvibacter sp.]